MVNYTPFYLDHSKAPSPHSYSSPTRRIKTNRAEVKNQNSSILCFMDTIKGNRIAISTSKIRKIIEIKKNRKEKGSRFAEFGSNPHSKGEAFSRLFFIFLPSNNDREKVTVLIVITAKIIL